MGGRVDLVTGLLAILDGFKAANQTLLRRRFTVRPPSLVTDLPCAYIDLRPETIHYDSAMRDRVASPSIVFVDQLTNNGETMQRMDVLADAFTEYLDNHPLILTGNGVWSDGTWSDESANLGRPEDNDAPLLALRFTFNDILIKDSRL